jgi:ornithine cyclodeaminase/alanine dehydrogenase-like protein (mu-crystallin family)
VSSPLDQELLFFSQLLAQVLGPHGDLQWHIAAEQLTNMRTAAASAVASQEIVPPFQPSPLQSDSAITIAIFGTGPVAAAHLNAFSRVYPSATFLIVSRLLQVLPRTQTEFKSPRSSLISIPACAGLLQLPRTHLRARVA